MRWMSVIIEIEKRMLKIQIFFLLGKISAATNSWRRKLEWEGKRLFLSLSLLVILWKKEDMRS